MNQVIICGRLTKDPDFRESNGKASARFTLAVNRPRRSDGQQQEADFIPCVAFDRRAEFVRQYLRQGMKMILQGRLRTGSYEKDGKKVYTVDVVLNDIEFAESKKSPENQPEASQTKDEQPAVEDGFMQIPDGVTDAGLPFN